MRKAHFEQWFTSAQEFYAQFEFAFGRGIYKIAAFELHQAVERFFDATLLVFTNYRPRLHDLQTLSHMVAGCDPAFLTVFPKTTDQAEGVLRTPAAGLRRGPLQSRLQDHEGTTRIPRPAGQEVGGPDEEDLRSEDRILSVRRVTRVCPSVLSRICPLFTFCLFTSSFVLFLLRLVPSGNPSLHPVGEVL